MHQRLLAFSCLASRILLSASLNAQSPNPSAESGTSPSSPDPSATAPAPDATIPANTSAKSEASPSPRNRSDLAPPASPPATPDAARDAAPVEEPPKSGNEPPAPERDTTGSNAPKEEGPPTLLSKMGGKVGAYGGVTVLGSRTMGQDVVYVGGEMAVLLDHRLALGLAGYGLASHIAGAADVFGEPQRLGFGYGGFLIRYSFVGRLPFYATIGALVGAGGVAYTPEWNGDWSRQHHTAAEPVFVAEPSLGGHLNITRWMRLGVQMSYRIVSIAYPTSASGLPRAGDLAGIAYGGHLQFGWF